MREQYEVMNHAIVTEFAEEICQEMKLRKASSFDFFKYFDTDKDGHISLDEFVNESGEICFQYSKKELVEIHHEIISSYAGHKKRFNLKVFRKLIYGYLLEDCRPLINHLRAELSYKKINAHRFFYSNDRMKDRRLSFIEFFEAVQKLDQQIEVTEADILFITFD
jgi:hypothetical protein